MVDYHLHTSRCGHAQGNPAAYLAVAVEKGLSEIGFADHFPLELLGFTPQEPVTMQAAELDAYVNEIKQLQKQADIAVKLAVEVDYFPGKESRTKDVLSTYEFDYIIGSVHYLDDWDFTHPALQKRFDEVNIDEIYQQYFTLIQQLALSGIFDVVGHLDVIKKFSYFPRHDWSFLVEETCRILKKADICVEVNTSGWRAPVKEVYPGVFFLSKCQEMNIPVTLGSDAHRPQEVASGFQWAKLILSKLGFKEIATFSARKRTMRPLL
ncbi:MAG: histidinol-phosphatase HisJ family protein [Firmicutes bacterium]|nr:histidinol-phosphatase HisJ family protein [Bacillota bacterium]